jgi:tetratricopeptide (TPR) repeat protein
VNNFADSIDALRSLVPPEPRCSLRAADGDAKAVWPNKITYVRISAVLARVRRVDLILAIVAALGIAAGLALTLATKFKAPGWIALAAGVVVGATAAISAVRGQIAPILRRQRLQDDRLKAILAVPIQPIAQADPFRVGVFPSELADEAQLRQPAGQVGGDAQRHPVPPYVPRTIDDALRKAMEEPSLQQNLRLVALRGDPKSGKSRTLWEAIQTAQRRNLIAVIQPDPAGSPADAAFEPLSTLITLDRSLSRRKGHDLVIWIDDAQTHLRRGLSTANLRLLASRYPAAIIALTIHSADLDGLRDVDRPLHDLLRRPFDDLILEPALNPRELADARLAYPALADNDDLVRLPELFASVNILTDRLVHHANDHPVGVAVAMAAIGWQRAGMPPGSIDKAMLRALTGLTLADVAPNRLLDDQGFETGLTWCTDEVAAFAALVQREPAGESGVERFRAFDGVVSWAHRHYGPLAGALWDFVIAHANSVDLLWVGIAAYQASDLAKAVLAWHRTSQSAEFEAAANGGVMLGLVQTELGHDVDAVAAFDQVLQRFGDSTQPELRYAASTALYGKGFALGRLGRDLDAVEVYGQVVEQFGGAAEAAVRQQVAKALVGKGIALGELGRAEEELAVYDQVVQQFSGAAEADLREQVAMALVNKGITMGQLGRDLDAVAVYDQVVEQFGGAAEAALRKQAAKALVNKAVRLGQLGRDLDAVGAYDQVVEQFGGAAEAELREPVANALVSKGITLGRLGRDRDAVAVYGQVVEQFGGAAEADLRAQVAKALLAKGIALGGLGRPEEEVAVYDEVVEQFGGAAEAALREQVARALVNKGIALGGLGRPEEEVAVDDEVVEQFGGAAEAALREQVARALVNKGITLGQLGRPEEVVAVYDQVVEQFGGAAEAALREQVARALVNKGVRLGRDLDAVMVYDQVVEQFGGAAEAGLREQVAKALVNKGIRLGQLGRELDAVGAYDQVVEQFGGAAEAALREQVAMALVNKAVRLGELGRELAAVAFYDQVVEQFGGAAEAALREQVARALVNKGTTLGQLGRELDAVAVYDQVVEQFGGAAEAALREQVAMALLNKGITLGQLGRPEEEVAAYDQVVQQFGGAAEAALREYVAIALDYISSTRDPSTE